MITSEQLSRILPLSSKARRGLYLPGIQLAILGCRAGETVNRTAGLIATIDAETGSLKWMEELGDAAYFRAYDGRMGNNQEGDGYRFRGRGFVMLTGRDNYAEASKAIGYDLLKSPAAAASAYKTHIFTWFWNLHNVNALCDRGDWTGVRRAVNGGTNGMDVFLATVHRAIEVLT